jgi:hypothetical protein
MYYCTVVEWVACEIEMSVRMHDERETSGRRAPLGAACGRSDGRPETRAIE